MPPSKHGGVCLNDALINGPLLITNLHDLLLQFRERPYAVSMDIAKCSFRSKWRRPAGLSFPLETARRWRTTRSLPDNGRNIWSCFFPHFLHFCSASNGGGQSWVQLYSVRGDLKFLRRQLFRLFRWRCLIHRLFPKDVWIVGEVRFWTDTPNYVIKRSVAIFLFREAGSTGAEHGFGPPPRRTNARAPMARINFASLFHSTRRIMQTPRGR